MAQTYHAREKLEEDQYLTMVTIVLHSVEAERYHRTLVMLALFQYLRVLLLDSCGGDIQVLFPAVAFWGELGREVCSAVLVVAGEGCIRSLFQLISV